jgi:L-aspartate oxidase
VDKTGYIIVGTGLSGLSFSLRVADHSPVMILTKNSLLDSNSSLAQGGIAAVMSPQDNLEKHILDTLKVGQGLGNRRVITLMVNEGPTQIKWLMDKGVKFDCDNGELHLSREGGHSGRRVVHAGDITGGEVQKVLIKKVSEHPNISIYENVIAVDLIIENEECLGIYAFDQTKNELIKIHANITVLGTGGVGQLYAKTSNPIGATGDGVAMAWRAGAKITDMEFIQFHPTILDKGKSPYFLISETFRGEGGILVNSENVPFMPWYHPLLDLAPRDVVSRAIVEEQRRGQVYIDIRHRDEDFLLSRFPGISDECLKRGIDITKEKIPVTPAAHYLCGGIMTNEYGETSIPRLLAFGECAHTGVHGANRLASNSLLECLAFTALSARIQPKLTKEIDVQSRNSVTKTVQVVSDIHHELQDIMWQNVGIIKSTGSLNQALKKIHELRKTLDSLIFGLNKDALEAKNMMDVASLITKAAKYRKESRGTHKLNEYTLNDDENWLRHIVFKGDEVKVIKIS